MSSKLFTEKQIAVAAVIAGPVPPGILIYLNFMRLGREREAYFTLAGTLIFTVALFYSLFVLPEKIVDSIPDFVFTAFYGLIVYLFFRLFLAKDVAQAFESGSMKASNWNVAGLSLLGLVINVVLIFVMAVNMPAFPGEKVTFDSNEVYYSEGISQTDIEILADELFRVEYFGPEFEGVAHLGMTDSEYTATIPVHKDFWEDEEIIDLIVELKSQLQLRFGKDTYVVLEHYPLSGSTERKVI